VLDTKERSTRRETIRMFKIQWNHQDFFQANLWTWSFKSILFRNLGTRFFLGGKAVTLR
jgi:hypothetical protein